MQVIAVTGLSGSGKSVAIRQLEDSGYYCIDNLPVDFIVPVILSTSAPRPLPRRLCASVRPLRILESMSGSSH